MSSAQSRPSRPGAEIVLTLPQRVLDGEGVSHTTRVLAEPKGGGAWWGRLEFEPDARWRPALRTGCETTQLTRDAVMQWGWGLGALYLQGALERAKRRRGWTPPAHPFVVREHEAVVVAGDGTAYRPRACARWEREATWVGWIEFVPVAGGGPSLRTDNETSQPTLGAVAYWADRLRPPYFEGALERAHARARRFTPRST
jgi:hypothetical protein